MVSDIHGNALHYVMQPMNCTSILSIIKNAKNHLITKNRTDRPLPKINQHDWFQIIQNDLKAPRTQSKQTGFSGENRLFLQKVNNLHKLTVSALPVFPGASALFSSKLPLP